MELLDVKVYRDDEGRISGIISFKGDLEHGASVSLTEGCEIFTWTEVSHGYRHGRELTWMSGELVQRGAYRSGLKHGVFEEWLKGRLIQESGFEDGRRHGVWRRISSDGMLYWDEVWERGKLVRGQDSFNWRSSR